jgi:hypothetical protein
LIKKKKNLEIDYFIMLIGFPHKSWKTEIAGEGGKLSEAQMRRLNIVFVL